MSANDGLLQCYNFGCGQKYKPEENADDSCCHHTGSPVFHDALKGWSCCKKRTTDFTEFLNIKGCQLAKHSNIKPVSEEKPVEVDEPKIQETPKPIVPPKAERKSFHSNLVDLVPTIAESLKKQLDTLESKKKSTGVDGVEIGEACKNRGCSVKYEGPETNKTVCVYHEGYPIFHEGIKYWSCCPKYYSDFEAMLKHAGCAKGEHVWIKKNTTNVNCRWDYFQTGSHVIMSIYAKNYSTTLSKIQLAPLQLNIKLVFEEGDSSCFDLNLELCEACNVKESNVTMFGTKVEIKLKKHSPGTWKDLHVAINKQNVPESNETSSEPKITKGIESVDLSDL
ncbi:PREDICTED: cysteine and histidine-rich domain-containing protein [Nicrophorus vespilloides]|uniref:Cysteine and histidine-rich domain-containing protein n=1 Tax=Nicrophorus vespilloides TaxID=110193 RepID=A0ABM1ME99_NICVS|nr:PREDICTED: cysteine and histidine-rich domain-containing protein [Nicrophorus vespilloides]